MIHLNLDPRHACSVRALARALLVTLGVSWAAETLEAQFLGFRYRSGRCVNTEGEEGLNPGYVGECGALRGKDFREANLQEVVLSGSDMHAARMTRVVLRGAVLQGVQIRNGELESADLRGADLRDAQLDRAKFTNADLTGANLQGARLERAIFVRAILRDANLTGANLRSVNLRGANLSYANLTGANLRAALFDDQTILPASLRYEEALRRGMRYRP